MADLIYTYISWGRSLGLVSVDGVQQEVCKHPDQEHVRTIADGFDSTVVSLYGWQFHELLEQRLAKSTRVRGVSSTLQFYIETAHIHVRKRCEERVTANFWHTACLQIQAGHAGTDRAFSRK